ncbi:MAG: LLM class flavin-dependent oxidoreductase [Actinomycetota bacterium]|nr:LLM class flavin-dependent oxidoreductase [Actinomycetota bacterium]
MTGVRLGVTLPQFTGDRNEVLEGARRAETAGLDSVWLFDHLWPLPPQRREGGAPVGASAQGEKGGRRRTKDVPVLEAWTTLAYLAAATRRITIGTLVTRSSLRHPAVLAKMAATAGAIAPGRIILGIGSGDLKSRAENEAYGLPYWSGAARREQLISTVGTLRDLFDASTTSSATVTRDDGFVRIEDLPPSPRVSEAPRVWVGGNSGWAAEFAGSAADGWNAWGVPSGAFAESAARATAGAAGRPIELSWGGGVLLGTSERDVRRRLGRRQPSGLLVGAPERIADSLGALAGAGASHLIASLPSPVDPECIELLAGEVKPLLAPSGG